MAVISVDNVSKRFMLAHSSARSLGDAARGLFSRQHREEFWALKDVSFEVEQGEALGIIGPNGAGKSTMLKLLTRIMKPTRGAITTVGRVSALIEVGAGFHPEMTGRENVFLNGSILGMSRQEIKRKLDDIVAFAELEQFIDTPVKRYSSGMYARLGFAVAAHVDPEILIVDEVLSVGDERFQTKCQEYMSSLMRSGVTVLFVTHNFPAMVTLCPRAMVLQQGVCRFQGPSQEAVAKARRLQWTARPGSDSAAQEVGGVAGDLPVSIKSVRVLGKGLAETEEISAGDMLAVEIAGHSTVETDGLNFATLLTRADGIVCVDIASRMDGYCPDVAPGDFVVRLEIPHCDLVAGAYNLSVGVWDRYAHVKYDSSSNCASFVVVDELDYRGVVRLEHRWLLLEGRTEVEPRPK